MICPTCGAEYRSGFTTCSDCGVPLVEAIQFDDAVEARQETGIEGDDAAALEPLVDSRSPDEIGLLVEHLEEARIPFVIHAGTALVLEEGGTLHGGEPDFWEARVWTVASKLEAAKALLAEIRRAMREG